MPQVRQAVVLAGGLGTRLRPLTLEVPKSLVPVAGEPILAHVLAHLRSVGIDRVVLCVGHLHEAIEARFGGAFLGMEIAYSVEDRPLGTGGAVWSARGMLEERFILTYGDTWSPYRPADLESVLASGPGLEAVMTVYTNEERVAPDNVVVEPGPAGQPARVALYDKWEPRPDMNGTDAGFYLFDRAAFAVRSEEIRSALEAGKGYSMERGIFPPLIARRAMGALVTGERYYDMGTPERLKEADAALARLTELPKAGGPP